MSELALGRARNASDAQRLILAARDGGCIGCELTSEHTQAHHIDYYEYGGLTEVPNLASMCWDCHTDLHLHDRKIHAPPDGRPRLAPPQTNGPAPPSRNPSPDLARAPARSP
ncbi:HNH endonuclease [Candidatus Poriferisodalis sp.]|uniref:HNH endonuclease n=1 Tax=Candidatus Poriferisodalis sp. TaxID=3101277 RepID=UPI003B59BAE3